MKRILALVLAVTLLLSLFVAPVAAEGGEISFEPAPSVNLTAVSYAVKSNTYISDTGAITSAKPNELLAVKLTLTNNAEKTLNWAGGQFSSSMMKPHLSPTALPMKIKILVKKLV